MIEQGGAETGRNFVIVFGDVADDIGKVVQRALGEEEAIVIHCGKSLRTSSMGTVPPASASWMPSSSAARVSSSSSSRIGAGSSRFELLHASHIYLVADAGSSAKGMAEIPGDTAIPQRLAAPEIYRQAPRERERSLRSHCLNENVRGCALVPPTSVWRARARMRIPATTP